MKNSNLIWPKIEDQTLIRF